MKARRSDVLVIGGGVLGASIAYHCACSGLSVTVLDRAEPLAGASGATFAWVGAHLKQPAAYNRHSQQAIALYDGLERALEADLELERVGSLILLEDDEAFERATAQLPELKGQGFALHLLDAKQVCQKEPLVPPDSFRGAWHCPLDLEVNPFKLVSAYLHKAAALGAQLVNNTEISGFGRQAGRLAYAVTPKGEYHAERIVLAAGIHTADIGRLLDLSIPIGQSRGQILVTEKSPRRLHGFLASLTPPQQGGFMMRQVRSGNILLGYTSETVDFDSRVTPEGLGAVASNTLAAFPCLADLSVIRAYAGIRPMPADGLPILSEVAACPGLIVAATHSGYTLSVLIGQTAANYIVGTGGGELFRTYALERFEKTKEEKSPQIPSQTR